MHGSSGRVTGATSGPLEVHANGRAKTSWARPTANHTTMPTTAATPKTHVFAMHALRATRYVPPRIRPGLAPGAPNPAAGLIPRPPRPPAPPAAAFTRLIVYAAGYGP